MIDVKNDRPEMWHLIAVGVTHEYGGPEEGGWHTPVYEVLPGFATFSFESMDNAYDFLDDQSDGGAVDGAYLNETFAELVDSGQFEYVTWQVVRNENKGFEAKPGYTWAEISHYE